MDTLEAIAYVSTATRRLTESDLEALLFSARQRNELENITGCLLFHDGSFLQYFEGQPHNVDVVYKRIKESQLHKGIFELFRKPIKQRAFHQWHMGFAYAPRSILLELSQASWQEVSETALKTGSVSGPMGLLLNFWRQAQPRA